MADEFMFGRSILATPILNPQYTEERIIKEDAMSGWDKKETATDNSLKTINWNETQTATKYLPRGTRWYDFWTGKAYNGGQDVTLTTAIDRTPMFVRAGSILPLGPEMEYVGQKSWENLEIRVYPGADGTFTLYEDEGDGYDYEKGVYATIPFTWNDKSRTLTIGKRNGSFPGMLTNRRFTVVLPDGSSREVSYDGTQQDIKL
jgi:alpha-D-xyloside xylohydrolase